MELDRAIELICKTMHVDASVEEEQIILKARYGEGALNIDVADIESILEEVKEYETIQETQVFQKTSAEFLVDNSGHPRPSLSRSDIAIEDEVAGYKYRLGRPTYAFAFLIADRLYEIDDEYSRRRRRSLSMLRQRILKEDIKPLDMFVDDLRISSLRIESQNDTTLKLFQSLADSFYFHIGYNLDYPVIPRPTLQGSLRTTRIQRLRRKHIDDLDAPRKKYIPDLVHNYQLALSSESPMLSYISYYHVAEHWFEDVFQNDIALRLQGVITSPGFSYKSMKDLRRLIKIVSDEFKTRDEELIINERTALKLTLERYVNIPELVASLDAFDSSLLDYYANTKVKFSGGVMVDLRSVPEDKLYGKLAQRIYMTRNALVHRKNGAKSRFAPFKDDHELDPELTMMRFIAEQIIITSATV
jgi:hypothetical protein